LGCALAPLTDWRNTARINSNCKAVLRACFSPALLTTTKLGLRTSTQVGDFVADEAGVREAARAIPMILRNCGMSLNEGSEYHGRSRPGSAPAVFDAEPENVESAEVFAEDAEKELRGVRKRFPETRGIAGSVCECARW